MWSTSKKEKQENKVTKTIYESHVSTTSQFLTVNNFSETYRTRSTSVYDPPPPGAFALLDKNQKSTFGINLDASPFQKNSPNYSSLRPRYPVTAITRSGTIFPSSSPATEKPSNKKLKVKKTKKLYDGPENKIPTYSTHSKNRGEVFIINNIMFKDKGYRYGAKKDDEKLKDLFKQMGFSVNVERNLKKSAMVSEVKSFSKKSSLKNADIAIVVIMSHGTKNESLGGTEVFGLDEQGVLVEELMSFFNEKDCKSMANKPKIFIFQCCRGDNEEFIQNDAASRVQPLTDALIAYSSLPGFVSHRDPEHGTWYISTICDVFSEYAHEYHVEDLLKMVDVRLGTFAKNSRIRQTTHYENRGFKRCYLHPM